MFTLSCLSWGEFCTNGKRNKRRKVLTYLREKDSENTSANRSPGKAQLSLRHFSGGVGRSLSAELWAEKVISRARRHQSCQFGKNVYRKSAKNFGFFSLGKETFTTNQWSCHYSDKCVKNHSRPLHAAGAVQCLELLSSPKNHFFLWFLR